MAEPIPLYSDEEAVESGFHLHPNVFISSDPSVVGPLLRQCFLYACPTQGRAKSLGSGENSSHLHEEFKRDCNIALFGAAILDFDFHDPSGPSLRDTLEAFDEQFCDKEWGAHVLALSSGGGLHMLAEPVAEWETTLQIVINGGAPMDVGCGHISGKSGKWSKWFTAAPSISIKTGKAGRWLHSESDPLVAFLEHTGFKSYDEVPSFLRKSVDAAIAWRTDTTKAVRVGQFSIGFIRAMALQMGYSPDTRTEKAATPKKDEYDIPEKRQKLVIDFVELHEKAVKLDVYELSPMEKRNNWLALCSYIGDDEVFGVEEGLEVALRLARPNTDKDEKAIRDLFARNGTGLVENQDLALSGSIVRHWCNVLSNVLKDPTESYVCRRLQDKGLVVACFGKSGNIAIDLHKMRLHLDGGKPPATALIKAVFDRNGLRDHAFKGETELSMEPLLEIVPPMRNPTRPKLMAEAASYFLNRPAQVDAVEILPVGAGPYALDPLKSIRIDPSTKYVTYNALRFDPADAPPNWAENRHLKMWIEAARWFCPEDDEHVWYVSKQARDVQVPWANDPTSAVLIGITRSGKDTLSMAVDLCFKSGCMTVMVDRATAKFNVIIHGVHRVTINEAAVLTPKQQEEIKNAVTAPRIVIEPKGIDAFEVDNRISYTINSNVAENGMMVNGGEDRWSLFANMTPLPKLSSEEVDRFDQTGEVPVYVHEDEDRKAWRHAAIVSVLGRVVQKKESAGTVVQNDFLIALTAYLANYKGVGVDKCIDTKAKTEARNAEGAKKNSKNKVGDFLEYVCSKATEKEISDDGWLRVLPDALFNVALEVLPNDPQVVSRTTAGDDTSGIVLQTKMLIKMLQEIRTPSSPHYKAAYLYDESGQNNFKNRMFDYKRGSNNKARQRVVKEERKAPNGGNSIAINARFLRECDDDA